jgi:hypothetical protein
MVLNGRATLSAMSGHKGLAMDKRELIKRIFEIVAQGGEEFTDGQILDQICALLNDEDGANDECM